MDGLELSTDKLDLAAPDRCDLTLSDFHEISRAAAALRDRWEDVSFDSRSQTCFLSPWNLSNNAADVFYWLLVCPRAKG